MFCNSARRAKSLMGNAAGIKTCKRNADDFSSCLRLALQESWPAIYNGIPELGIPNLNPYYEKFSVYEIGSKEFRGKVTLKDEYFYGLNNAKFTAVRPEYTDDKFKLEIDFTIPKWFTEADYNVDANLANFKMNGKGHFNASAEFVKITWFLSGFIKNDRWVVEEYRPRPYQLSKLKIWADDLFNGSPELTKAILDFINEFWPSLYRGVSPFVEEIWSKYYTPVVNNFFSKISFDEIFPPS
ncbi:hypothetical protein M0802_005106 [Mischocyttarus mexicanus]|nr:hypothetical protein M0802_005106 [Mischocyttarus mexicanus]